MCVSLILLPWTASLGFSPQPHPSNPLFLSFKWSAEEGARSQGATRAKMQKSSWTPSPESLPTPCPRELWSVQKCPWPSVEWAQSRALVPQQALPMAFDPISIFLKTYECLMAQMEWHGSSWNPYHGGNMGLRTMKPGIWNCWPLHDDGWSNWTWLGNLLFSLRFVPPLHLCPARTNTQGPWFSWPGPVIQINVCLHTYIPGRGMGLSY